MRTFRPIYEPDHIVYTFSIFSLVFLPQKTFITLIELHFLGHVTKLLTSSLNYR